MQHESRTVLPHHEADVPFRLADLLPFLLSFPDMFAFPSSCLTFSYWYLSGLQGADPGDQLVNEAMLSGAIRRTGCDWAERVTLHSVLHLCAIKGKVLTSPY